MNNLDSEDVDLTKDKRNREELCAAKNIHRI